jgi:hypothetical protein
MLAGKDWKDFQSCLVLINIGQLLKHSEVYCYAKVNGTLIVKLMQPFLTLTCQTSTGQIVWQVVRRDGDQVDGKWMVDA